MLGQTGEETFDQVDPRTVRWCEVAMEPRMTQQPVSHLFSFVRPVVIQDQMHIQVVIDYLVDMPQKADEIAAAMTSFQFADDMAGSNVQCSKQRCGAMAPVIVSMSFRETIIHRQ